MGVTVSICVGVWLDVGGGGEEAGGGAKERERGRDERERRVLRHYWDVSTNRPGPQ